MDEFLTLVSKHLDHRAPHLLPLLEVMSGEARFALTWLADDLDALPGAATILEIGGGSFLLSCALARRGFDVTTLEPTGAGFDALEELGNVVLELAAREAAVPRVLRCKAEEFTPERPFRFAFSVNVMEHVEAPDIAVRRVSAALVPGASYRFLCPNYLFPYEPHFNMPTLGSKKLTERLWSRRIHSSTNVNDPTGLWNSLNWITVPQVRRIAAADPSLSVVFERRTTARMVERAIGDPVFARRRAPWMATAARILKSTRLLRLAALVPAACQPLMDVRLTRLH